MTATGMERLPDQGATGTETKRVPAVARKMEMVRAVNDQIWRLAKPDPGSADSPDDRHAYFVCECPLENCFAVVPMTVAEWEAATSETDYYVAHPLHVTAPGEHAVVATDRYAVARSAWPGEWPDGQAMEVEAGMAAATAHEKHLRRVGKNQSLFREVNERVSEINEGHGLWVVLSDWVCECANVACTERIELTPEQYERVRENPTHFVVAPGAEHVVADAEHVLERHERYWVVSKVGDAAAVAISLDSPSRPDEDA